MVSHFAENDAATYCGAEYGEVREGECECPRCVGPFPDPLQDWPMPGYLKPDAPIPPATTKGAG